MAIRRTSLDSYSGLRGLTVRDDSVLAEKISRLIIWYSLQKRDLSDEDKEPAGFLPGGVLPAVRHRL